MESRSTASDEAPPCGTKQQVVGRRRSPQPLPLPAAPARQGTNVRRLLGLVLLGVVAVLGHGGSWAYPGWWIGVWAGHASLILLATMFRPRAAFLMGVLLGALANGWAFHWAPAALERSLSTAWWQSYALFSVLVGWESVEFGLFCGLIAYVTRGGLRGIFLVPALWVVVENFWPKVFPWLLGYSQMELLPLIQIADITGSCGVGFCITAVTAIPAAINLWRKRGHRSEETRGLVIYMLAVGVLISSTLAYGFYQIRHWKDPSLARPTLRIAAMQFDTSVTDSDFKLRNSAAELEEQVDLVCWPESSLGTYCENLNSFSQPEKVLSLSRDSFDRLRPTQDCNCDLLAAGRTYPPTAADDGPYRMTAFLIDGEENIVSTYHKRTLLPFGEYIPGQMYFPVLRQWATFGDIIEAGDSAQPLVTSNGTKLGVVICYEDLLRANVRENVLAGAEIVISLINDSAFENPLAVKQHYRLSMMRAVENRRCFIRCAGTGVSCLIAPTGEVIKQLEPGAEGIIRHDVTLHQEQTLYTRYGEVFPVCCASACALALGLLYKRGKSPSAAKAYPDAHLLIEAIE